MMITSVARRLVQLAGVVALVAAGGLLYHRYAPRQVPKGQPPLAYLSAHGLDVLRAAFNAASDQKRLLLLLSPT